MILEPTEERTSRQEAIFAVHFVMATKGEISGNELVQALFDYVYSACDDLIKSGRPDYYEVETASEFVRG